MACTLLYSVRKIPQLRSVELNFLEPGHTQMECDSMHSAIEYAKKNINVFAPSQWDTVVIMAQRKRPYTVIPLKHPDFFNIKQLERDININFQVDEMGKRVNWLHVKSIKSSI